MLYLYKFYYKVRLESTQGREAETIEVVSELEWEEYSATLDGHLTLISKTDIST